MQFPYNIFDSQCRRIWENNNTIIYIFIVFICVVCAVQDGKNARVGVDAERIDLTKPVEQMERIATRWFSEAERAVWNTDPTPDRFFGIWTAKESASKYLGHGLRDFSGIDTANPNENYGQAVYRIKNTIITLTYPIGEVPPRKMETIEFLS